MASGRILADIPAIVTLSSPSTVLYRDLVNVNQSAFQLDVVRRRGGDIDVAGDGRSIGRRRDAYPRSIADRHGDRSGTDVIGCVVGFYGQGMGAVGAGGAVPVEGQRRRTGSGHGRAVHIQLDL